MCRELFFFAISLWFLSLTSLYASDEQKTPIPVWHTTLDDISSITVDGGQIINPPVSFVPGAVDNAFAGNGSVYATWDDDEVETIFRNWDDNAGWTIDLYFLGEHWSNHSGDSGLWSIVRRYSDAFIIASVQDGSLRLLLRDASGEHTQHKYHLTDVPLIDNTAYRLTMRQYNGAFEVFLDGSSVFTAGDLPTEYTCPFVAAGGGIPREMNIGRRAIFGGTLQSGEWVDNVCVYNGFYTPDELDAESRDTLGDLDEDGMVYFQDLYIMTSNWLFSDCKTEEGNLDETGLVDFLDFSRMSRDWLMGVRVTIAQQPMDIVAFEGETASFHISAAGPEPIRYKWQKDGLDLTDGACVSGATTNTLEIKDVNTLDSGDYRCEVMNNYSTTLSEKATLTVVEYGDIGISPSGHYIKYRGDTLMLIGESGTQCATQNSNFSHRTWIDDCNMRGIRAIHLWSFVPVRQKQDGSQIEDRWGYIIPDVMPWARKTSGPLAHDQRYQWDLRVFDEGTNEDMTHYWPRMRDICSYAKSNDMLVGITMFTGWSKHDYSWVFHPFNINNGGYLINKEDAVIIASPGTEIWQETWSDSWSNSKKIQWVWEKLSIKAINELGSMGNVFFVFFDEHSYSEGNMGDHFRDFFRKRGQIWMDWEARRSNVNWVMSDTFGGADKNSYPVSAFNKVPFRPYFFLEGEPYQGSGVRTAIWTFSIGGGNYFFHADAGQETVRTGIMGYDPYVPIGDKGMYKRDWLGHASRFINEHVNYLDSMVPHNELSSTGIYCLADPGLEYVVYCKVSSPTTFDLDISAMANKTINCRFYNPRDGQFEPQFQRVGGSSAETFTKPTSDDWILHVIQE